MQQYKSKPPPRSLCNFNVGADDEGVDAGVDVGADDEGVDAGVDVGAQDEGVDAGVDAGIDDEKREERCLSSLQEIKPSKYQ